MLKELPGLSLLSLGVIGAAFTLFANMLAPLNLADWAWWMVGSWQEATPAFWDRIAAWFGPELPNPLIQPLNLAAFLLLTSLGVGIRDRHREASALTVSPRYLAGGGAALFAIGYIILTPVQSSSAEQVVSQATLTIFLAAAAASFSRPLAGRGNLIKRLWYVLGGVCALVVLNEFTKLAVAS
jgi:hypothetical protein